jgi:1-deoxy-D-xylulose-5-phosphate reductoisomerase
MAGHLVMRAARQAGVEILPVDSEHSALWQCLRGEDSTRVRRLLITASGGPFRRLSLAQMRDMTPDQALNHPTWRMGPKITIDSATLMNKGLEVIEAHWLYDMPYERIAVVVHPQSIIHSMVEFVDDSIKMQASIPSMHLPIQYALSYPDRLERETTPLARPLRWDEVARLDFENADLERFPCLKLAFEAGATGGSAPAALVGADETAVELFMRGAIRFTDIAFIVAETLQRHNVIANPGVEEVRTVSAWAQEEARRIAEQIAPLP